MHLLRSRIAELPLLLPVPSQLVLHGFSVHGVWRTLAFALSCFGPSPLWTWGF